MRSGTTTRRGFLDTLLGLSALTWMATVIYPIVRFLKPLPYAGPSGPMRLTRSEVGKLEAEKFVIVPVSGKRILVFQDAQQQLRALDAKCTHEGCTVQYVPGESVIWCACHNARFDLDGQVLSGPPPRPLPKYFAERRADGGILVAADET